MLQLHEAGADGGDVTLLVGKRHPARSLGVLQLRVSVYASIAHASVQLVHDHREFTWQEQQTLCTQEPMRK
jgi:hypothetical protein